jgi:hypothetical protein
MDRNERVQQLMQQAEKLGLRLEFDCGLLLVRRPQSGDPDRQEAIIAQLARYPSDVHRLMQRRASGIRGKDFVGARVWSPDGAGTLVGGSDDGTLTVRVGTELRRSDEDEVSRSQMTIVAGAENLLVVVDEKATDGAASPADGPASNQARGGFFDRLRGSSRRD